MANNDTDAKPERSLNRQLILDEDEYTAALSHIIARDFFPSLVHLDATNEYLDAVRTRDPHLIAASVRRLEQVSNTPLLNPSTQRRAPSQTPGRTPYALFPSDTPFHESSSGDDERAAKRPRYDSSLSLDEFQARYTSEDNASFTHILDEENKKRREKYGWAWEAQKKVEAQRERMIETRERMLIEPAGGVVPGVREKFRIEAPTPVGLITATDEDGKGKGKEKEKDGDGDEENEREGEGKDGEMAVVLKARSVEEATEAVMAPRKDNRTAGVDGWEFKVRDILNESPRNAN
jgi:protein DGCR14